MKRTTWLLLVAAVLMFSVAAQELACMAVHEGEETEVPCTFGIQTVMYDCGKRLLVITLTSHQNDNRFERTNSYLKYGDNTTYPLINTQDKLSDGASMKLFAVNPPSMDAEIVVTMDGIRGVSQFSAENFAPSPCPKTIVANVSDASFDVDAGKLKVMVSNTSVLANILFTVTSGSRLLETQLASGTTVRFISTRKYRPSEVLALGDHPVTVIMWSDSPLAFGVFSPISSGFKDFEVDFPRSFDADPGKEFVLPISITNYGNEGDIYDISLSAPADWKVSAAKTSEVLPGLHTKVDLVITPPAAFKDRQKISMTVRAKNAALVHKYDVNVGTVSNYVLDPQIQVQKRLKIDQLFKTFVVFNASGTTASAVYYSIQVMPVVSAFKVVESMNVPIGIYPEFEKALVFKNACALSEATSNLVLSMRKMWLSLMALGDAVQAQDVAAVSGAVRLLEDQKAYVSGLELSPDMKAESEEIVDELDLVVDDAKIFIDAVVVNETISHGEEGEGDETSQAVLDARSVLIADADAFKNTLKAREDAFFELEACKLVSSYKIILTACTQKNMTFVSGSTDVILTSKDKIILSLKDGEIEAKSVVVDKENSKTLRLFITNNMSEERSFDINLPKIALLEFELSDATITIPPKGTEIVALTITPQSTLPIKKQDINVEVVSEPYVEPWPLTIYVGSPGMELSVKESYMVAPGEVTNITLPVRNKGDSRDEYVISVEGMPSLVVPKNITVEAGQMVDLPLLFEEPEEGVYDVTMNLQSSLFPDRAYEYTFTVEVSGVVKNLQLRYADAIKVYNKFSKTCTKPSVAKIKPALDKAYDKLDKRDITNAETEMVLAEKYVELSNKECVKSGGLPLVPIAIVLVVAIGAYIFVTMRKKPEAAAPAGQKENMQQPGYVPEQFGGPPTGGLRP